MLLLWLTAYTQETKLITKKFDGSKQISESYFVLTSDGKIRHGEFVSYFQVTEDEYKQIEKGIVKVDRYIKQTGSYVNGKKDGEWIEYSMSGQIKTKGNYENDKKVGIWLTSKEQGRVFEKFDHDNKRKLPPIINIHTAYPKSAVESDIEGTVTVSFQTHSDCTVSNITVTKGLSADCDKAAIESIGKYGELLKKYGVDCEEKMEIQEIRFVLK